VEVSAFRLAERFVGVKETAGGATTPVILAMLQLDQSWPEGDEVPWCSAFANWIAWLLRLPRSKSLRARSWLGVGKPIGIEEARAENDVVILKRRPEDPGPEDLEAPGHVGFFAARLEGGSVLIMGGNQGDAVRICPYREDLVLGVRRLG
jgi:uncharacterized protein (TIGR02594 family)